MGFYSLRDLKDKDGARLVEAYEQKMGYWVDSCVEDQFRLAVDFARHHDKSKRWWDFTQERKTYRTRYGYPTDRPTKAWHLETTI